MVIINPPKKLWKGKKRLAKMMFRGNRQSALEWALTIRPGDYIATCEGCNRKVAKIEYHWVNEGDFRRLKQNKTWFLYEVSFEDTHGRIHNCPGGGCAYPKQTNQEILAWWGAFPKINVELDENGEFIKDPVWPWNNDNEGI